MAQKPTDGKGPPGRRPRSRVPALKPGFSASIEIKLPETVTLTFSGRVENGNVIIPVAEFKRIMATLEDAGGLKPKLDLQPGSKL